MTRKINNENIDQEEFLKRLKTGGSAGMDDFEKDAFEGFESLENIPLAEKLNAELNKKIEDKYFKKEGGRSKLLYFSMAAGLALIVGLSVIFFNNMTSKEPALAMKTDEIKNATEQLSDAVAKESAPPAPPAVSDTSSKEQQLQGEGKKKMTAVVTGSKPEDERYEKTEDDQVADKETSHKGAGVGGSNGPAPKTRLIVKEEKPAAEGESFGTKDGYFAKADKKAEEKEKRKEADRDDQPDNSKTSDTKLAQKSEWKKDENDAKKPAEKKTERENVGEISKNMPDGSVATSNPAPRTANNNDASGTSPSLNEVASTNKNKKSNRAKDEPAKQSSDLDKAQSTQNAAAPVEVASGGMHTENGEANLPLRRSSYFKTAKFANHTDYFKAEIDKNETLKNNLTAYGKAFRIDLIVTETGKVTEVTVDIPPTSCSGCKASLEKIIKEMPLWEPAQNSNGKAVKQSFYFNYKY